jgi:hypothetical protein
MHALSGLTALPLLRGRVEAVGDGGNRHSEALAQPIRPGTAAPASSHSRIHGTRSSARQPGQRLQSHAPVAIGDQHDPVRRLFHAADVATARPQRPRLLGDQRRPGHDRGHTGARATRSFPTGRSGCRRRACAATVEAPRRAAPRPHHRYIRAPDGLEGLVLPLEPLSSRYMLPLNPMNNGGKPPFPTIDWKAGRTWKGFVARPCARMRAPQI